jgi:hypothetical protein
VVRVSTEKTHTMNLEKERKKERERERLTRVHSGGYHHGTLVLAVLHMARTASNGE